MGILVNSIVTPDGTRLVSRHRHDFVGHKDKNGKQYYIDGGMDYIHSGGEDIVHTTITTDHSIEIIRDTFEWGSYGIDGREPLHYIKLKDMEDDHIKSVLSLYYLSADIRLTMLREQSYRATH